MARKTVQVTEILTWANNSLCNPILSPSVKQGIIFTLEKVLHSSGNYYGFRYTNSFDALDPEFAIGGNKEVSRFYFSSPKLQASK